MDTHTTEAAMEKTVASILLLLSLEALLLVAGVSAATSSGAADMDILRLPSETASLVPRMAVVRGERKEGQERPWECCDKAVPGPTTEGTVWYCMDMVEKCTCESCYKLEGSHSYYCLDGYHGSDPGPTCSHDAVRRQERPWKCCDKAVPGPTTQGMVWYCMDKVEKCTCESCYELKDSHSYYCLEGYQGSDPGPSCSHE